MTEGLRPVRLAGSQAGPGLREALEATHRRVRDTKHPAQDFVAIRSTGGRRLGAVEFQDSPRIYSEYLADERTGPERE